MSSIQRIQTKSLNAVYSADYSNTYYHLDSSHIQRKNPLFNGKVYIDFVKYQTIDSGQRTVISQSNFEVILLH